VSVVAASSLSRQRLPPRKKAQYPRLLAAAGLAQRHAHRL